jgi:methionine synthase II (cobalamin-independent)
LLPKERIREAKLTLEWYHLRYKAGKACPKEIYASNAEYFADIAKAYRTELEILYDAGLRNVQIDGPNLACKILTI